MDAHRRDLAISIGRLYDLAGRLLADAQDRGVPTPSLNDPAYRHACDSIVALEAMAAELANINA